METVIGHVVDGLDYAIDKSVYQKSEGTVNISAGDMASDTVDSYTVTVNKQDVIDGFNKAVEAIFDDSSITPYITMLNTMGSKIDKETIKKEFADGLQDFASSMTFTMYAKNDAFAGISVDASSIITDVKGNLDIVALANDGVYNVLYVEAKGESGDYIKYSVDGRENVKKMSINADLDDAYMKFEFQYQVTDNSIEFKKLEISGRSGIQNVSFSMTAKYEGDDISSISMSDSDFANAVDVSNMSESQSAAITQKLLANAMKVLNDILSEKGLKEIGKLALE